MIKYYPFEMHCHTHHSDGSFSPKELAENIKKKGLYGFALTDHNTISGQIETEIEAKKLGLVFLKGLECTTFYGHITIIGEESINADWKAFTPKTIYELAQNITKNGSLIGIAHPFRIGYPICTGGQDEWGVEDYKPFTHYEVWSSLNPDKEITNAYGYEKYIELSEKGNKLACIYGRDLHSSKGETVTTMTCLGINGELSTESAVDAIKNRRTYISTNTIMQLELLGDRVYHLGEVIKKGNYKISGSLKVLNPEFKTEFTKIKTKGGAHSEGLIELHDDGSFAGELKLDKGLLIIEVVGKIQDENTKLIITTPFYVE